MTSYQKRSYNVVDIFQDIVNELGRRLDFEVTNGRYRGTVNITGYDGIFTGDSELDDNIFIKYLHSYSPLIEAICMSEMLCAF